MKLFEHLRRILLEDLELQIKQLKDKYVGEGKPMSENDFKKIQDVSMGKFYLLAWLSKRVGMGMIKPEDIYKYKEYFEIFEKNKKRFTHKDINLYKTKEDLNKFLDEVFEVREGDIKFDETIGQENFVSKSDIEKLESSGGIKYLGLYDNKNMKYQVFQVSGVNQEVWKLYRDILGRCKGRASGAKIDICTIGDYEYFKMYLKDPKGSSYFVLFNLEDRNSPYQLHYESGQFMDKNDRNIIPINQLQFFKFVGNLVPKYSIEREDFPGAFSLPVEGKGGRGASGQKEGVWKTFNNGRVTEITTYRAGVPNGPFVNFFRDGKIDRKGTYKKGFYVGEFEEYYGDGDLLMKGVFSKDTQKIGIWHFGDNRIVDFSSDPPQMSGLTKNGKLRFISDIRGGNEYPNSTPIVFGKIIYFYPSGGVEAIGQMGKREKIGNWTFYFPNGKIRGEGRYYNGLRDGEWVEVAETEDGMEVILVNFYETGRLINKAKVYDKKGNFLKKVSHTPFIVGNLPDVSLK